MNTTFQLDTSGIVKLTDDVAGTRRMKWEPMSWPDLSPFAQGYVEAMFASLATPPFTEHPHLQREGVCYGETIVGFQDLAPETLALILRDCEENQAMNGSVRLDRANEAGARFWEKRQAGERTPDFPPLTPYLGDDGKVYLR